MQSPALTGNYPLLMQLKPGDIVQTTHGTSYVYESRKQKYIVGVQLPSKNRYKIPFTALKEIVGFQDLNELFPPTLPTSDDWNTLQPGELFMIDWKGNCLLYEFVRHTPTKIIGKNPLHTQKTVTIDCALYRGRIPTASSETP